MTVKAAEAVNVNHSAIPRWVNKLRLERQGKTPAGLPLTPKQLELREARKKIQRLEMENVAPLQGERHGFTVPVLCMTGAPLYTQLHVYPASRQTPFHRQ
ncbi:transposase [Candidatus Erwinia dacicola]